MDLEETLGKTAYAEYDFFGVASERTKYKLSLGTYSGKACKQLQKEIIEMYVFMIGFVTGRFLLLKRIKGFAGNGA